MLIVIIVLMVLMFKSCGKGDTTPANTNSVAEVTTTAATTTAPVDNSMAVYLSPSTQYDNLYAHDNATTEAAAMIDLASRVKAKLEAQGFKVYMCGPEDSVKSKVAQGNQLKCGAYVALHSNSGGESGSGEGTECFYNTNIAGSKALAECIYNNVAALTPTEDRGLKDQTQRDLYEIEATNNVTACCLLEVEFHDIPNLAQWIMDHQEDSAQAIANGIITYLNSTKTTTTVPVTEPVTTQAGALY